ncbi:MAG: TerC family protein [Bacteroidota bacterium]|jgi:tellurite resistance protein TerC|nr:TerC family protein [Cytophagales bacterium]MCE2956429.1 TerC family protein [Flammeovirgaceae bacterium]MCZ8069604.1 TerC family protein [Cytophagales bacterium]
MLTLVLFGREISEQTVLYSVFGLIIGVFLLIDLGFFNKSAHKITTKSALYQSIFWVVVSTIFGYFIYLDGPYDIETDDGKFRSLSGLTAMVEYFTAYLTEYALSVDNIFVILLILKYFQVKEEYFHRILFWGILGAVVFRGAFIFVGAWFVAQWHWILYIFGVFLIYSGVKIYFEDSDEKIDPEKNPILRLCRKYLPITKDDMGGKFLVRHQGKLMFTPLFLVIVLIETTDLIFAVDSIPAAFAITQSEMLIYTSNIFAVMGLRAMFFLLSGIIDKFYLLQKGLSIILFFIGAKMLLEIIHVELPPVLSFAVIIATLTLSIVFSMLVPRKDEGESDEIAS